MEEPRVFDKASRPGTRVRAAVRPGSRAAAAAGLALLQVLASWSWTPEVRAQAPPPELRYQTLHTENFRVTYPEGLEEVGARAAERAERAFAALSEGFLPPPATPIDLLVTDHMDISNGFARVAPSNRIVIWLRPPVDGLALSHFDDWLELVITHELVHVFHLDYAGPLGRAARAVFGRPPRRWPFFVGNTLPSAVIEGVAVHLESDLTDGGRLHGTFQDAMVRGQAAEHRAEGVDQALGASPVWPGGNRPYVYGSLFFVHLAERFGDEAVAEFLKEVAHQWIPYRLDAAARRAFGEAFHRLWEQWRRTVEARTRALQEDLGSGASFTEPELLTRGARMALHAAPHPSGNGVAFVRSDGRSDVRLVVLEDGEERTVSRWNSLSRPAWTPRGELLASQPEFVDPYRLRNDLYRVEPNGRVTRLTRELRAAFVDSHPGDGRLVAVLEGEGTNRLALLDPEGAVTRTLREAEPGVLWSYPAWSPDGRKIAVSRWRAGGWNGILLLDEEGRTVAELSEDRSLHTAPAWSPDGSWVLWSSDRTGVMNVFGREVTEVVAADREATPGTRGAGEAGLRLGPLRQVTHLLGGGHFPAVSPDGRWVYFSALGGDGWDLARTPYEPGTWTDPLPADPRFLEGGHTMEEGHEAGAEGAVGPYRAFSTLRPRYWLPLHESPWTVAGTEVLPRAWGLETSGTDLLGRHSYAFRATAPLREPGRRFEARARYDWAGLGSPVLFVEGDQLWRDPFLIEARPDETAPPDTVFHAARERAVGLGAELQHRRVRRVVRLSGSGRLISQDRRLLERDGTESETYRLVHPSSRLVEGRASLSFGTARGFPFSVSTQEGLAGSLSVRERRETALPDTLRGVGGFDGSFRDVVGVVVGYRGVPGPGFADHVLAVRLAAGTSSGPGAGNNHFSVGGGGGGGEGALGFTYDVTGGIFPVRGFPRGEIRGRRAWGGSAEWRVPLRILHRGFGAWPLHLDRLAAGVFVDAGGAERVGTDGSAAWTVLSSAGVELGLIRTVFFEQPALLRGGLAVPLRGGRSPSIYAQFGWGF